MQSKNGAITTEGYGPWYVFLLVNVHLNQSSTKKQTEIVLNSDPELYQAIHNHENSKWGVNIWIILLCMGPFEQFHEASEFHAAWLYKSRGQATRICRGIALAQQLKVPTMHVRCTREQALDMLKRQRAIAPNGDKRPNSLVETITGATATPSSMEMIRMHQINSL